MKIKFIMLVSILLLSLDIVSSSRSSRRQSKRDIESAQQQLQQKTLEKKVILDFKQRHLPFIDLKTNKLYNFPLFACLAMLCGPVMMIRPVECNGGVKINDDLPVALDNKFHGRDRFVNKRFQTKYLDCSHK